MFTTYDLSKFIFWSYWGTMLGVIAIALLIIWLKQGQVRHKIVQSIACVILIPTVFIWILMPSKAERKANQERKQRYETGKAIFAERCKNAGEKIYKTVDNVDGVMLLKIRTTNPYSSIDSASKNAMWESAAAASEFKDMSYIATFLNYRSSIYSNQAYRYIDILQNDQSIIRYEGTWNYIDKPFQETLNPKNPARYAVTFEDDVNPEDRKYWVAGTTIKIIDLKTNEILGERTIYAFEHGQGNLANARMPWLRAEICPEKPKNYSWDYFYTFLFVHKVLKPKWETVK